MALNLRDGDPLPLNVDDPLPPNVNDNTPEYDEEANERDEYHMEKLAQEFTETEASIRHDCLPDSDDERDPTQNREDFVIGRGDWILYKGQTFFNGVAFKEAVVDYALHTGFNIKQYRWDKDKICYKCIGAGEHGSCDWQVYASSLPKDPTWTIRIYKPNHKCIPNGRCVLFKSPVIARIFMDKIREDPDYYLPQKIEETIKEKWKISVTRPQCRAARNTALKWIEYQYDQQFARLRDYAAEIAQSLCFTVHKEHVSVSHRT